MNNPIKTIRGATDEKNARCPARARVYPFHRGFCDGNLIPYSSDDLDTLNWSAESWTSDSTAAAAFLVISMAEMINAGVYSADDFDMLCGGYVFLSNGSCVAGAVVLKSTRALGFYYIPSLHSASYALLENDGFNKTIVEFTVQALKDMTGVTNARYVSFEDMGKVLNILAGNS